MITFAWYLLKVIICSGILYGYYMLALRDKIFHKYNRFYLLAAIVLSITAPLIKINVLQKADEPKTQAVQLLQAISSGDEIIFDYAKDKSTFHLDANNIAGLIYCFVASLLLIILIQTLIRIFKLKKKYNATVVEGINFISSNAKGTPFSFFNNIFWNEKIDINSPTGKQIFKHEVAHVQERHSYDKVFMNIVLILFWCNPLFWRIRKELNIIHEFIADQKALENSDTAAFAAMILQATYPQQQFTITNNFFYSPLKRRLAMLTKNKNPKINYVSRVLVLPLAALVFFAFTLKMKAIKPVNIYTGKILTVVIDAGHGGDDNGIAVDNINEKDLTLSIAKKIKELNKNNNIQIILSREEDKHLSVQDRVIFSQSHQADLFISIHIDGESNKNTHSGMTFFIPQNDNAYLNQSKLLGSGMLESFKSNYQLPVPAEYKQRDKGVYVLKANQCPSILIEAGFLTTQKDLNYLIKQKSQEIIARNILNGIEKYAQEKDLVQNKITDTIPKSQVSNKHNDEIIKLSKASNAPMPLYLVDGNEISAKELDVVKDQDTIVKTKKQGSGFFADTKNHIIFYYDKIIQIDKPENTYLNPPKSVLIMNGKKIDNVILNDKAIKTKTLTIYSGHDIGMIAKYGDQAKNGVFIFEDGVIIDKPDFVKTLSQTRIVQELMIKFLPKLKSSHHFLADKQNG